MSSIPCLSSWSPPVQEVLCFCSNPVLSISPSPSGGPDGGKNGAPERTVRVELRTCPLVETGLGGQTSTLDWDGGLNGSYCVPQGKRFGLR